MGHNLFVPRKSESTHHSLFFDFYRYHCPRVRPIGIAHIAVMTTLELRANILQWMLNVCPCIRLQRYLSNVESNNFGGDHAQLPS